LLWIIRYPATRRAIQIRATAYLNSAASWFSRPFAAVKLPSLYFCITVDR
jgi:hypothetical protein